MKRRDFLKNSLAASALTGLAPAGFTVSAAEPKPTGRELYEYRMYRLKPGADHALLDAYLEKAAIPALNRLGCKPVGVFTEIEPKEDPAVFVLVPYPSVEVFLSAATRLGGDTEYQQAGAEYLQTAKDKPGFARIDSWLLLAFAGLPKLEQPPYSKEKRARVFEVRTYESYSEAKAAKKVEMFNDGEIEIMREVGLGPIFYGQGLVGKDLPHLTYMLSAEDREAHKQHWKAFGAHPKWKMMSTDPRYKDTVSNIKNRFLSPAPYSQI